jgi:hypothetical protein
MPCDRRGLEAAIDEIRLELSALLGIEVDRREPPRGRVRQQIVRLAGWVQLLRTQGLDVGRHLVDIDTAARQRGDANDLDGWQGERRA